MNKKNVVKYIGNLIFATSYGTSATTIINLCFLLLNDIYI